MSRVMAQIFVGVDGGGSKTSAVVVDERGQEIGRGVSGASNYQGIGLETAAIRPFRASNVDPIRTCKMNPKN